MDYIQENIQMVSQNTKINICKLLKNNLTETQINEICCESADGTRINLDDLDENIINHIYTMIKNEIKK
jgi:hypothetical protein